MNKTIIRKGVFETNSSSAHSLSISDDDIMDSIPGVDNEGQITIYPQNFNWEIENYNDFDSKATYLAIYCRDASGEMSDIRFMILETCIKEVTQCDKIIYANDMMVGSEESYTRTDGSVNEYIYYDYDCGNIDHQSIGDTEVLNLFDDIDAMKRFLFNSGSILHTDNDNH